MDRDAVVKYSFDIAAQISIANRFPVADTIAAAREIHTAMTALLSGEPEKKPDATGLPVKEPAVPIKKSITADAICCLEDGRWFKSLKRHLRTAYKLTPEQYRERWNLPSDYPMVSPNYAAARSKLAKQSGLGFSKKK